MGYPTFNSKSCINWENWCYSIKDPEKTEGTCLDCEDAMGFLRLGADAVKGSLAKDVELNFRFCF